MEKREVLAKMGEVLPLFDSLNGTCTQYADLERKIEALRGKKREKLSGGQIAGVIAGCMFYIVPGIIVYVVAKSSNKKQNEKLDSEIASLEQQKDAIEAVINQQINKIGSTGIQEILPGDYMDPVAVQSIYSYLYGGRADSMKEAINLYEEEKHRANMESMQNEYLRQAQIGNKLAAWGNVINAANAINNSRR